MPSRQQTSRGVVTLEFIVGFTTVLTLLMGLLQVAHGYVARLLVNQAAIRAARAASVWVHEEKIGKAYATDVLDRAHAAAALTLAPISPPMGTSAGDGAKAGPYVQIAASLGAGDSAGARSFTHWSAARGLDADFDPKTRARAKLAYAFQGTVVSYSAQLDQNRVTATVRHAYYCPFPLANVFYGHELTHLVDDSGIGWQQRLIGDAGLPGTSRIVVIEATQEHFIAPLPEG